MDWSNYSIPAMRLEARFGDRVVLAFADRPKNIWEMVANAAARNPDGEALICGEHRLRWRDVIPQSAQVAAGLRNKGLRRGDRIALLLGNRIEFVLSIFAAAHLGLVTVLLSTRQQKPEIAYVLADCGAKLLIYEAAIADRLPDAGDVPDLQHRIAVDDDVMLSEFLEFADWAPLERPPR
jgi:acyl-CoA synthetase (AMP-forming)/AMP-acid ligase II